MPLALLWHITLPLIRPALLFALVTATSGALTLFVQPYLLTAVGPGDATRTLSELIYDAAFQLPHSLYQWKLTNVMMNVTTFVSALAHNTARVTIRTRPSATASACMAHQYSSDSRTTAGLPQSAHGGNLF